LTELLQQLMNQYLLMTIIDAHGEDIALAAGLLAAGSLFSEAT
jgi:hypothetical protein